MSASFNGTTSVIQVASSVIGSTPAADTLVACWAKPVNLTARHAMFSISDGAASASSDLLYSALAGDQTNDPIRASILAAGAGVAWNGTFPYSTSAWQVSFAHFQSSTSRRTKLGSGSWTSNTTSVSPTGLAHTAIGAIKQNVLSSILSGLIAEVAIWTGVSATIVDNEIVTPFLAGTRPLSIVPSAGTLVLYQPLKGEVDGPGYVGPSMTPTDVTYDAVDHPITYGAVPQAMNHYRRRRAG